MTAGVSRSSFPIARRRRRFSALASGRTMPCSTKAITSSRDLIAPDRTTAASSAMGASEGTKRSRRGLHETFQLTIPP
jgi:hypothetical protein